MNYYPFHIGDYAAHTRGLSLLEDLAYRRLLDDYYRNDGPLSGDVARAIGMQDHEAEVSYVLSRFFTETPEGWRNARADKEIASFQRMKAGGAMGAAKRWSKAGDRQGIGGASPSQTGANANQNQEPRTKKEKERSSASADQDKVESRLSEVTDQAMDAYNTFAKMHGLPQARRIAIEKKRAWVKRSLRVISEVCEASYGSPRIERVFWAEYFEACAADPFLRGEAKSQRHPNWLPDFEYFMRPETVARVYERVAE